jgi:3-oxoacyl-[acyl-carrier protein] reductase
LGTLGGLGEQRWHYRRRYGNRGQANYAAAKAALLGMALALAREAGPDNLQVNAVLPAFLRTAMTSGLPAEVVENATGMNALGRLGTGEEVARFVVFLTTMQHVSGQVFQLDSRILPWT